MCGGWGHALGLGLGLGLGLELGFRMVTRVQLTNARKKIYLFLDILQKGHYRDALDRSSRPEVRHYARWGFFAPTILATLRVFAQASEGVVARVHHHCLRVESAQVRDQYRKLFCVIFIVIVKTNVEK